MPKKDETKTTGWRVVVGINVADGKGGEVRYEPDDVIEDLPKGAAWLVEQGLVVSAAEPEPEPTPTPEPEPTPEPAPEPASPTPAPDTGDDA